MFVLPKPKTREKLYGNCPISFTPVPDDAVPARAVETLEVVVVLERVDPGAVAPGYK